MHDWTLVTIVFDMLLDHKGPAFARPFVYLAKLESRN